MKKRVLSLLLCLVMCLSLIPTVAFAATYIDKVSINGVKTPRVGAKAGSFLKLTTPDSTYTIVKSYWVCNGSGTLDDNGVFQEGKTYYLCVTVMPANGYYLDKDTEFVFNGGAFATQVSSKNAGADGSLFRNTTPIAAAYEAVDTVNIMGIKMPMSGVKAGDNLKGLMPASAGYTIVDTAWMCAEDNRPLAADEVFVAGKTYLLYVSVTAKDGYTLSRDTAFTFNNGNIKACDDSLKGLVGNTLYQRTMPITAKVYIDTVNITGVKTPAVGAKAGDFLNLSTTAATYTIADACWRCKTDSRVLFSSDVFEAEKEYYLSVELTPADGYILDDGTRVLFNGGEIAADDSSTWISSDGHLHGFTIPATIGKRYNVTFSMNGYGTAPATQTVLSGGKATKPANPTASGYIFGGWYKDAACITAFDFNTPITENTTVYARWTPTAPAAPTLSISKADGKITISWNAVSGANKYWIYRSTDGTNFKYYDMTTKTSYTNSSVTSGTKYYYKVKAVKTVDGKDYASSYSAAKSTIPLTTPTLSISKSAGKIKLSWNAVTGANKYWIYRSTDGTNFKYYDATTNTSYTNSSVTSGTKYYYKVKAVKNVNGTDWVSSYSAAKSTVPMTTPTLSATVSSGKVKLSWGAVTGATKYWIYRSTDGTNFSYYDSTTGTSYTNSSVTAGKTYYYKIKAVKTINSTDWASDYSNVVSKKP